MDTRLSGRRHRRTRASTIQNHDRTPQKPLHRRQTRQRKNTGRASRRVVLYARRGRLPKGVKSPQPKADRKGQSQTVQALRAQHPLKYLLHIANLPKSSFYSGLNLNQDKATKRQTVQIVRQGEATPYWFKFNPLYYHHQDRPDPDEKDDTGKGALPQHWVGTAKKQRG